MEATLFFDDLFNANTFVNNAPLKLQCLEYLNNYISICTGLPRKDETSETIVRNF